MDCLIYFILITTILAFNCNLQNANEYMKILEITGSMACRGHEYCRESFNHPIVSESWLKNDKGHCSVTIASGTYTEVTCGCNNHYSGVDNIDSTLRIDLKKPPPTHPNPPPTHPNPPPSPPPSHPPSPSSPTGNSHESWKNYLIFIYIGAGVLGFIGCACFVCLCCNKNVCSYNICCSGNSYDGYDYID